MASRHLQLGALFLALAVALAALAAPMPAAPPAQYKNTTRQKLYVNSQSFSPRFAPVLIERATQFVANAWSEYGSASRGFDYAGTTTSNGCVPGQHVVHAVSGILCNPFMCDCAVTGDACVSGYRAACGTGSEVVINTSPGLRWAAGLWPGNPSPFATDATPLQTVATVIAHELGHNLIDGSLPSYVDPGAGTVPAGHVPVYDTTRSDVMNYHGELLSGADFGLADVEYAASFTGTSAGTDYVSRLRQSTLQSVPLAYPWFDQPFPYTTGWGGYDISFGYVGSIRRSSLFEATTIGMSSLADFDETTGVYTAGSPGVVTRRATVSLFDPEHLQWWVFVNERGSTTGESFLVHAYRSSDRFNWLDLGFVGFANLGPIHTRFPVAVDYDRTNHQVVLVYTNGSITSWPSAAQTFTTCGQFYECYAELIGLALPWNAMIAKASDPASGHRFQNPATPGLSIGYGAMDAPAVACGTPSASGMNCELLFTGMDSLLAIHSIAFRAEPGTVVANEAAINTGGLTNARISYASNNGKLIAACVGIGNTLFVAGKNHVGDPTEWTQISRSPGSGGISARRGVRLRARPEGSLDLFYINQ